MPIERADGGYNHSPSPSPTMPRLPATLLSLLLLHLQLWSVSAKPGRRPHYAMDEDNNIVNNYNDRYTVELTVDGTPVNVMLDTGSTDMWVAPPGGLSGKGKKTGAVAALYYGDGSNFVNGSVDLGSVEIAGYTIADQAYINVLNSVGEESDRALGIFGLVGLGFDGPFGTVPGALTEIGLNGTEVGEAVLSSIFKANPTKGQYFSFSLNRIGDVGDTADATLVISDVDPAYSAVLNAPVLPQYPARSQRWSIVSEGISVNGQQVPWKSYNKAVPANHATVLLDTGTTNFLVPAEVRDAVYSAVPGAVLSRNSSIPNLKFSEDEDTWVIPCNTPVNITTRFAGQDLVIHPLDLSDMAFLTGPDGKNYTVCIGSMTNGGPILGSSFDALYGDSFLRNVYSVFSFGNATSGPYVQLLPDLTSMDVAVADFHVVRGELLENAPQELAPADIIRLFDGPSAVTAIHGSATASASVPVASASATTSASASGYPTTGSGLGGGSDSDSGSSASIPECTPPAGSDALKNSKNAVGTLSENDTSSSSSSSSSMDKWGPIIVGLLSANLLLLILVAALGVMNCVRNGRTAGATRGGNAKYAPVKLKEDAFAAPRGSYEHDQVRYSD
ncbi:Six-hairpin glycosidase [Mycena kentingensis (nom. inval.)]|nr:Six-hairpin glycosidase [Mycena kentingensis (nom. inval.)]